MVKAGGVGGERRKALSGVKLKEALSGEAFFAVLFLEEACDGFVVVGDGVEGVVGDAVFECGQVDDAEE